MFYLAIGLIGIGLFLMLFIFLSPAREEKRALNQEVPSPPVSAGITESLEEPMPASEAITEPEKIPSVPSVKWAQDDLKKSDNSRFQWVNKIEDKNPQQKAESNQDNFSAEGILFIDYGRQVHINAGNFDTITPEIFMKLQRMGRSDIVINRDEFSVHTGNASYRFAPENLEQIFFMDSGIALVPLDYSEPVFIFLTESVDDMRSFIRKYSRESARA